MLNKNGFTLVETILAIMMSALIMTSLAITLNVSFQAADSTESNQELAQHARVAMSRITHDLRYAAEITMTGTSLAFDTVNLTDDDATTIESISYVIEGSGAQLYLTRYDNINYGVIAGSTGNEEDIRVTFFQSTPQKIAMGNVVPFMGGDTLDMCAAVVVEMQLQDSHGNTLTVSSMAGMRK